MVFGWFFLCVFTAQNMHFSMECNPMLPKKTSLHHFFCSYPHLVWEVSTMWNSEKGFFPPHLKDISYGLFSASSTLTLSFVFLAKSAVNLPHHESLSEPALRLRHFSVPYKMLTAETLIELQFSRAINGRNFTHGSSCSASSTAQ